MTGNQECTSTVWDYCNNCLMNRVMERCQQHDEDKLFYEKCTVCEHEHYFPREQYRWLYQ